MLDACLWLRCTGRAEHHAALPYVDMPDFMEALRQQEIQGRERRQWTAPTLGRNRDVAIDAIARRFAPSHAIILHDRWRFWQELEIDLAHRNWTLTTLRAPRGPKGYFVLKLSPP